MDYKNLLDPQLRNFARNASFNKPVIMVSNLYQKAAFKKQKNPEGIKTKSIFLNGFKNIKFKTDIFESNSENNNSPCLIYIHGGAFCFEAAASHKTLVCRYTKETGCKAFFPHYKLAPKFPFPAGLEDIMSLYRFICKNTQTLGIDSSRIAIAGDSAGAALATLALNRYKKEHLIKPCSQLLIYPVTDVFMTTKSMKEFTDTPIWNSICTKTMWSYYLKNLNDDQKKIASPLYAELPSEIPDTYIETTEFDCLRDEGFLYAQKLKNAGAKIILNETKGTFHGYDTCFSAEIANNNICKRIAFLKEGFLMN